MFGTLNRVLEIIRRWFEELLAGYGPELILNGSFEEEGGAGHEFQNNGQGIQVLAPNDRRIWGWEVDPFSNGQIAWVSNGNSFGFDTTRTEEAKDFSGRLFVDLTNQGSSWTSFEGGLISGGVLSAEFDTETGGRYLLSMLIGTYEGPVHGPGRGRDSRGPSAVRVVAGDTFGARLDNPGGADESDNNWILQSLVFIARGPKTEVEIRGWIPPDLLARREGSSPKFIGLDNVSVRKLWRVPPWRWQS
jgi:hypothetical protein